MKSSTFALVASSLLTSSLIAAYPSNNLETRIVKMQTRAGADTKNDLMSGACKDVMIVFARGTTETGNVGSVAGPPFFDAMDKAMPGKVAVQGVEYPADIPGFLAGGDKAGSAMMVSMANMSAEKCPNSKIVLAGYSQGGQLVHNAAVAMPPATMAKVAGAVIFGDPNNKKPVGSLPADKTKVICHATDNICMGGDLILVAHLTYGGDAEEAAKAVQGFTGA